MQASQYGGKEPTRTTGRGWMLSSAETLWNDLGTRPVDSAELEGSSNFHVRSVINEFEDPTIYLVPMRLALSEINDRELRGEIVCPVVAMLLN